MYDRLEVEDYTESNQRDYELYECETGCRLHKCSDKDYRNGRQNAYNRKNAKPRDRTGYNREYYQKNKEKIKEKNRERYNKEKNTEKCRKYAKKHSDKLKEYQRNYYQEHKEKKLRQAKDRYSRNRIATKVELCVPFVFEEN